MTSLTVPQLKKFIEEDPNFVVVDVRSQREVEEGMIPGAVWMDASNRDFIHSISTLSKDKTYCLYCASGGRTSMIAPFLEEQGLKVYDLDGGIGSWMISGNKIEKR